MKECPYCCEPISDHARKCKECGEIFSPMGRLLRIVPILSVLIAAGSLGIAWSEIQGREAAEKREQAVSRELEVHKIAADQALSELADRLPHPSLNQLESNILGNMPPERRDVRARDLELRAREEPENIEVQREALLLRAIQRPH